MLCDGVFSTSCRQNELLASRLLGGGPRSLDASVRATGGPTAREPGRRAQIAMDRMRKREGRGATEIFEFFLRYLKYY
jgi:hypothetical protein